MRCYIQSYTDILENINKTENFLGKHKLLKLIQE